MRFCGIVLQRTAEVGEARPADWVSMREGTCEVLMASVVSAVLCVLCVTVFILFLETLDHPAGDGFVGVFHDFARDRETGGGGGRGGVIGVIRLIGLIGRIGRGGSGGGGFGGVGD